MRSSTLALLSSAPLTLAQGPWWGGAPDCAHSCLSSYWTSTSTSTSPTAWPNPGTYCTATQGPAVASCLSSACSATPTAAPSYSSLSSSLCSRFSSCSSAGSTGVYTYSAPAFTGTAGPPFHPPGAQHYGPPGGWSGSHTWSGGAYTVTGCEWDGSPWAGGPGAGGDRGDGPWGQWGNAWSWTTQTLPTVTATVTGGGKASVITGPATVAVAVSGGVSSTSIVGVVGAAVTGSARNNVANGVGGDVAVRVVGVALGAVGLVVGML